MRSWQSPEQVSVKPMDTEQALDTMRKIQSDYQELSNTHADLENQLAALDESLRSDPSVQKYQLQHFLNSEIPVHTLTVLEGLKRNTTRNLRSIFTKIWTRSLSNVMKMTSTSGVLYFVPKHEAQKGKSGLFFYAF